MRPRATTCNHRTDENALVRAPRNSTAETVPRRLDSEIKVARTIGPKIGISPTTHTASSPCSSVPWMSRASSPTVTRATARFTSERALTRLTVRLVRQRLENLSSFEDSRARSSCGSRPSFALADVGEPALPAGPNRRRLESGPGFRGRLDPSGFLRSSVPPLFRRRVEVSRAGFLARKSPLSP
jgi:hypothetical protein